MQRTAGSEQRHLIKQWCGVRPGASAQDAALPASGLSICVCLGYGDALAHRDAQAQRAHQSGLWAGSGDPGCCHDQSLRAAKLCSKVQGMGGYWRQAAGERLHCSVLTVADKCVIVVCLLTLQSLLLNIHSEHATSAKVLRPPCQVCPFSDCSHCVLCSFQEWG